MERRAQFNLAYLLFALIAMLALQQWWQRAQTVEVVPYSEFEKLLAEHRIDEVVISDQRITGKFKSAEGGKTVAVANSNWWGKREGNIGEIVYQPIVDANGEVRPFGEWSLPP